MKLETRLKEFLLNIMKKEGDIEAWEHYKTLNLECDDLDGVIMFTPFARQAWEVMKHKDGTVEDFIHIVEHAEDIDIQKEAEATLLQRYSLDNEALAKIVKATQSDEAAKLLLNQNPSIEGLNAVLCYSKQANEAAKELLKQDQENDVLHEIMVHSNLKHEAWEKFIQQSPTKEEIIEVIRHTDLEDLAWKYLLSQNPSNEELMDLVNDYFETGRKVNESAEFILQNNPSAMDLVDLIHYGALADDAWEHLSKFDTTLIEDDLNSIVWRLIRRESCKKNEAAAWCLNFELEEDDLWHILDYSDQKDKAALKLLEFPLELHQLADIVVESTIEPVLKVISERVNFDRSQVNEAELIREIAQKLLQNPDLLNVNHWHQDDTHCLGGWAIILHEDAQQIEKLYGSEIAACLLLPNYKHLFFADRETVLKALRTINSNN